MRPFAETSEIEVPDALIDQVLGQREARDIIRQAAMQRRHVLLIGVPGTGKSLLGQAMAELTKVAQPEDILMYPNPEGPTSRASAASRLDMARLKSQPTKCAHAAPATHYACSSGWS